MRAMVVVMVLVLAAPGAARADGTYFAEELGTFDVRGELGDVLDGGGVALRAMLGRRVGRLAVEGGVGVFEMTGRGAYRDQSYTTLHYGVDVKYHWPLSDWSQVYVRGGLRQLDIKNGPFGGGELSSYSGRALAWGAGIHAGGKVPALGLLFFPLFFCECGPKVKAAVTFDWSHQQTHLSSGSGESLDGGINAMMVGFAVGSDF